MNSKKFIGITDQLSIKWNLTPVLRPNEIGIFTVGTIPGFNGILIPPQQQSFEFNYYCHFDCINVNFKRNFFQN
jgi:hypothetical protein